MGGGWQAVAETKCSSCKFRAAYDRNPRSITGRLWKWHTGWCPGWKSYLQSLPEPERKAIAMRYRLRP